MTHDEIVAAGFALSTLRCYRKPMADMLKTFEDGARQGWPMASARYLRAFIVDLDLKIAVLEEQLAVAQGERDEAVY